MTQDVEMREERAAPVEAHATERVGLFESDRAGELKERWSRIQGEFVDDPREAVKAADTLVDEVLRDLTTLFNDERTDLEHRLKGEKELSTEDLRLALRRYRSFFERLLSV